MRRGDLSTEERDGGGSTLCLREGTKTLPRSGGKFCNLSDCQRVGGVAMFVTGSGVNARGC